MFGISNPTEGCGSPTHILFFHPLNHKTMNKLERYCDAAMTVITYLAAAGGFYWIFVRFIITYLKTL